MKTCNDCIYPCKADDNEPCERFKSNEFFHPQDSKMRYTAFLSDSIEVLKNEQVIGCADSYQEICKIIDDYLAVNHFHQNPCWRFLMGECATFIDYGSWSKFVAIVPPVPVKELMGE